MKPAQFLKIALIIFAGIIVFAMLLRLLGASFNSLMPNRAFLGGIGMPAYDSDAFGVEESALSNGLVGAPQLSVRNVPPIEPGGVVTGNTAEDFEVTHYSGTIETRDLDGTCKSIADLKALSYVIFENANAYEHGCNYTFKVENDHVAEVLAKVKALDPKELAENTYTIKRIVDDFTAETEVLENKRDSIEKTLADAIRAYEEITGLAAKAQDVETLAKIIDSKLRIIERLTQERINVNEQLDRLSRSKADQLDRLAYTYFSLNVYENKFVDGEDLKDSWKAAVKQFVQDMNRIAQDITINLVALLFFVLQYALYILILVLVAKYGWKAVKYIWEK